MLLSRLRFPFRESRVGAFGDDEKDIKKLRLACWYAVKCMLKAFRGYRWSLIRREMDSSRNRFHFSVGYPDDPAQRAVPRELAAAGGCIRVGESISAVELDAQEQGDHSIIHELLDPLQR